MFKKKDKVAKVEEMDEEDINEGIDDDLDETTNEEEYSPKKSIPSLKPQRPAPKKTARILRKSEDVGDAGILTTIVYLSDSRIYDTLGEVGQEFNLD